MCAGPESAITVDKQSGWRYRDRLAKVSVGCAREPILLRINWPSSHTSANPSPLLRAPIVLSHFIFRIWNEGENCVRLQSNAGPAFGSKMYRQQFTEAIDVF